MKLELRRVTVRTPRAQDARRSWPERESLLLRLTDDSGVSGAGEASPLPGYSPEPLDAVHAALSKLEPERLAAALAEPTTLAALSALSTLVSSSLPSGRMALETAGLGRRFTPRGGLRRRSRASQHAARECEQERRSKVHARSLAALRHYCNSRVSRGETWCLKLGEMRPLQTCNARAASTRLLAFEAHFQLRRCLIGGSARLVLIPLP